ncbi:MAG TPA: hypothetical protein VFW30_00165 [Bryocella sp.]|nr:hypothetical protein [Bryocella sp.]
MRLCPGMFHDVVSNRRIEDLVVEAKRLSIGRDEVIAAVAKAAM